jgi:hypothetical protein
MYICIYVYVYIYVCKHNRALTFHKKKNVAVADSDMGPSQRAFAEGRSFVRGNNIVSDEPWVVVHRWDCGLQGGGAGAGEQGGAEWAEGGGGAGGGGGGGGGGGTRGGGWKREEWCDSGFHRLVSAAGLSARYTRSLLLL